MKTHRRKFLILFHFLGLQLFYSSCDSLELNENQSEKSFFKIIGGAGEDFAWDIKKTPDQGFVLVGTTNSQEQIDVSNPINNIYLAKVDGDGVEEWSQIIYDPDYPTVNVSGRALVVLPSGNEYLVCGTAESPDGINSDIFLARVSKDGFSLHKRLGSTSNPESDGTSEFATNIVYLKNEESYLILGSSTNILIGNFDGDHSDGYVHKVSDSIDELWDSPRYKGLNKEDTLIDAQITRQGETIVFGTTIHQNYGNSNYFYAQITEFGGSRNPNDFILGPSENLVDVVETGNGDFILIGNRDNGNSQSIFLIKISQASTDSKFEIIQSKEINLGASFSAFAIERDPNGGYVIIGTLKQTDGNNDIGLIRLSETMETLWHKSFGQLGPDEGKGLTILEDGSIVFIGTLSFGSTKMICLVKTDPNGDLDVK